MPFIYKVMDGVELHVRTCTLFFCISGMALAIVLKLCVLLETH